MRVINKKILLIILLVGIILTCVIFLKPHKDIKLDNVILKQEVNNKTFAMYKETDNGYEEYMENKFPEGYALNIDKSKCVDNNGNEIENALYKKDNKVGVRSNKSFYCYLYFDKNLGFKIKEKTPRGLSIDKERGAMYRFQGQARDENGNELVDNYICFGTSDKDECIKDTDHYMYRIIGIEAETGRVKVIKKEALNEIVPWWDNYDDNIEFPNSRIYEKINGTVFLTNKDYVPDGWEEKIALNLWMYGDSHKISSSNLGKIAEGLYLVETGQKETIWDEKANEEDQGALPYIVGNGESPYKGKTFYYIRHNNEKWSKTFESKVSLMYLHDYHYSINDTANCQYDEKNYEICKIGWMNISQNDTSAPSNAESTMVRLGLRLDTGWYDIRVVYDTGGDGRWHLNSAFSVRPVFYINASEELLDGEGTITEPFIIKSKNVAS